MSHIGIDELIFSNNGEIQSGGFGVQNVMLKNGTSPIMTLTGGNNSGESESKSESKSEKVSDMFLGLAIPAYAYQHSFQNDEDEEAEEAEEDADADDDDFMPDDLYDKLFSLMMAPSDDAAYDAGIIPAAPPAPPPDDAVIPQQKHHKSRKTHRRKTRDGETSLKNQTKHRNTKKNRK